MRSTERTGFFISPMVNRLKLVKSIRRRESRREGIGLASDYVGAIRSCLASEACEAKFGGIGTEEDWKRVLKEARSQLTYTVPGMDYIGKASAEAAALAPANSCMTFTAVITTAIQDRDGDVLEPAGAVLDPAMPLLWQHIPLQPIGKYLSLVSQDNDRVVGNFAIIDNELGRDAAALVEFGALRISHGFDPLKFEPMKPKRREPAVSGPQDVDKQGYHVVKYVVMETSVVSVPSNVGAVITAFSRSKLHHPVVKAWAGSLYENRTKQVTSGFEIPVTVKLVVDDSAVQSATAGACACKKDTTQDGVPPANQLDEDELYHIADEINDTYGPDSFQVFAHHDKGLVHVQCDPSEEAEDQCIQRFGAAKRVKSVTVDEVAPETGKGYRMVYPAKRDHKAAAPESKGAVAFEKTKTEDQGTSWDGDAATDRMQKWAGVDGDKPTAESFAKYRRGFAWFDEDSKENLTAYKLPHHDIKDGELVVNFKACAAVIAVLNGGRGGVNIPEADRQKVYSHIKSHYEQFGVEAPELKALEPVETKTGQAAPVKSAESKAAVAHAAKCGDYAYGSYSVRPPGMPYFSGSYEWIADRLEDSADDILDLEPRDSVAVIATFPDHAVLCCRDGDFYYGGDGDFDEDDGYAYYRCAYTMTDGEPVWSGEPEEVELATTIAQAVKGIHAMRIKSGRAVSAKNGRLLKEVHANLKEVHDDPRTAAAHKTVASAAMVHVKTVAQAFIDDKPLEEQEIGNPLTPPAPGKSQHGISGVGKSGRVLSDENLKRVKSAREMVHQLAEDDTMHRSGKALLKEARGHLDTVIKAAAPIDNGSGVTFGLSQEDHQRAKEAHGHIKSVHEHKDTLPMHKAMCSSAMTHIKSAISDHSQLPLHDEEVGNPAQLPGPFKGAIDSIKAAHELAYSMHGDDDMHADGKSYLKSAIGHLKAIIESAGENPATTGSNPGVGDDANPGMKQADKLAAKLMGHIFQGQSPSPDVLVNLQAVVNEAAGSLPDRMLAAAGV